MFWQALGTEVNQSASPYDRTLRVFATFVAWLTQVVTIQADPASSG